jgi:hypothetical protein
MKTIQTQAYGTGAIAKRFVAPLLIVGALGIGGCKGKETMVPVMPLQESGLTMQCKGPKACKVSAKKGDTLWNGKATSGGFETGLGVADVDERGVVFSMHASTVPDKTVFRVNYDGSTANYPMMSAKINVERTSDSKVANVKIE